MKTHVLFVAALLFHISLQAQDGPAAIEEVQDLKNTATFEKNDKVNYLDADSTWWSSIQLGLNYNQSSFTDNWAGGGVNSFAFGSPFNAQLHYLKAPWSWDNQLDLQYGIVRSAADNFSRKSVDRIFADSKIGYQLSKYWNAFAAVNFLTQFAPGYNFATDANGQSTRTLISEFMAPGFLTTSLGLEYRPVEYFWLRISPFSPRFTFVTNTELYVNTQDEKNYGVPIGETVRKEWLAFQLMAELNKNLTQTLNLQTRYVLFANYETLAFNTLDHRLDLLLNAKLTRFLNFSIGAIMLYDIDQNNQIQFAQTMGVGLLLQK